MIAELNPNPKSKIRNPKSEECLQKRVIQYLKGLEFNGELPEGISIMNPIRDNPAVLPIVSQFYNKFYDDHNRRSIILGINPGRFGAGTTGIPFTDSKRLAEKCGIIINGLNTFETSSVFIYDMIDAFGGTEKFYGKFFLSAVCPLGFTLARDKKESINYNYYDSPVLLAAMKDFIIDNLMKQLDLGIDREVCFCLGTGRNYKFLLQLNNELSIFKKIVPLEHPRFIMQYKLRKKNDYIEKYLDAFNNI